MTSLRKFWVFYLFVASFAAVVASINVFTGFVGPQWVTATFFVGGACSVVGLYRLDRLIRRVQARDPRR